MERALDSLVWGGRAGERETNADLMAVEVG